MKDINLSDINKASEAIQTLLKNAPKESWLDKNWAKVTTRGYLATLFIERLLIPFLQQSGVDVSALNIDIPTVAWVVGGCFVSVHLALEKLEKILKDVLIAKLGVNNANG
jgi:hypothetical protein